MTFAEVPNGAWFHFEGHPTKFFQKMKDVFAVPYTISGLFPPRDDAPVVVVAAEVAMPWTKAKASA